MFKKLTGDILGESSEHITFAGWVAGFTVIVLLRSFFEAFSTTSSTGFIVSEAQRVHYLLFFVAVVLLIALVVTVITKQKSTRVITLALYGLPVIFLAPIIDLALNAGKGVHMSYLNDINTTLLTDFLTFFGAENGITIGIRIEIFIILCTIGWYVWMKRRRVMLTIVAILLSYIIIFILLALPGVLYTLYLNINSGALVGPTSSFIWEAVTKSNIPSNVLHGSLLYGSSGRLYTLGTSAIFSQMFFIISFISGLALFWYTSRDRTKAVFINARPERVLFYLSLITLGSLYALTRFSVSFTWVDFFGFIVLAVSWFSAWMFAVHTNDIADVEIDSISNPNRPIPKKSLSAESMRDIGYVWLILSLVGSYIVGYYVFFMNIIFTCAYYLYSAPPLRLKQIPILSSFLISIACLSTVLAGFFFFSPNKIISAFPSIYALGIIVLFTIGVNIRDIKDVAGDKAAGVSTLPVLFGTSGKKVVGVLFALSLLFSPIFFHPYITYFTAFPFALAGYYLCAKERYRELPVFILFATFILCSITLYLATT